MPKISFTMSKPEAFLAFATSDLNGNKVKTESLTGYTTVENNFSPLVAVKLGYKVDSFQVPGNTTLYPATKGNPNPILPADLYPNAYYTSQQFGGSVDRTLHINVSGSPQAEPVVTTEEQTKTVSIPFTTINQDNPTMEKGTSNVVQEGVNGSKTVVETVTFSDGVETNRVVKSETVTTEPIPKIVDNGTLVYGYLMVEGDANVDLTAVKDTGEIETGTPNVLWKLPTGNYTLTLKAKTGFYINSFSTENRYGQLVPITIEGDGKLVERSVVVGSRQDFSYTTDLFQEETEEPVPEPDFAGFNHLYKMDKTAMSSLANDRFTAPTGNPGEEIDLGVNIINILELPFPLSADFLRTEKNVILGIATLNTVGIELVADRYVFDFAEIVIPHKFNNSYDFIDTEVKLHLPFVESITLPNEYCIGQTIKIRYSIDLYSGDTDVTISSTKLNNKIFYSQQVKLGRNIPFVRKSGETVTSNSSSNGLNNNVYSPFVEVIRNKPYNAGGQFTTPIPVLTTLNEMQGFVRVEDIRLQTNATQEEQQAIKNLLRDGVFINGTN